MHLTKKKIAYLKKNIFGKNSRMGEYSFKKKNVQKMCQPTDICKLLFLSYLW